MVHVGLARAVLIKRPLEKDRDKCLDLNLTISLRLRQLNFASEPKDAIMQDQIQMIHTVLFGRCVSSSFEDYLQLLGTNSLNPILML